MHFARWQRGSATNRLGDCRQHAILQRKPWAAIALVGLAQTNNQATQRVQLEPRGSRRLSSQALLDMRVSKTFSFGGSRRIELLVLNVLNDTAEEGLVSENLFSSNFALPNTFVDPRRAMVGLRANLAR
jgi:hypothetical protein